MAAKTGYGPSGFQKGMVFIYTLACPNSGSIVYVGCTNNMRTRYNSHITDFRTKIPVRQWILNLIQRGQKPIMELIETCPAPDKERWENYWICQFKSWGFGLFNQVGGEYGKRGLSQATRQKISKKLKGQAISQEIRAKLGKKVCMYDLDGNYLRTFISSEEAHKFCNITNGIPSAIRRDRTAAGYRWRYYIDNYKENIGKYSPPVISNKFAVKANERPVAEIDASGGEIARFSSIQDAYKKTGVHNIGAVCRGIRDHADYRFFKFIDKETLKG